MRTPNGFAAVNDESEHAGSQERARAAERYRVAVRTTGIAVVFGLPGLFVVDALLPTTTEANRQGLLISAALVAAAGAVWFGLVPRRWFGGRRVFAAAAISEVVLFTMVFQTGGLQSLRIGYLVLPIVALILAGSARQIVWLGGLVVAGIAVLGLAAALAGDPSGARDSAVSRLLLLSSVVAFCVAVARTTGRDRTMTTERAAGLADESATVLSMAMTDVLTNLPNRRALDAHLGRLAADATRTGLPLSVMAIDLDGLKAMNDAHGHAAGDVLLRNFGAAIDRVIRGGDVGFRIGGDEFLILLPRTDGSQAERVAVRLHEEVSVIPTPQGPARFSHGIAALEPGGSGQDLVRRADAALYASKRARSGNVPR